MYNSCYIAANQKVNKVYRSYYRNMKVVEVKEPAKWVLSAVMGAIDQSRLCEIAQQNNVGMKSVLELLTKHGYVELINNDPRARHGIMYISPNNYKFLEPMLTQ